MTSPGNDRSATSAESATGGDSAAVRPSDVRLVQGYLRDDELAAVALVVSAMSVTSRLEAEERMLAEGRGAGAAAWNDPVHTHPRTHALRARASATAWQFSDR